jgi:hypothetical protein
MLAPRLRGVTGGGVQKGGSMYISIGALILILILLIIFVF